MNTWLTLLLLAPNLSALPVGHCRLGVDATMSSLTHVLPSSQSEAPVQTTSSARLLKPTTLPIPLLSSPVAKRYSYAHTVLVPVYYYLRSSALVADPLPTMVTDLLVIGTAQALFCSVCLPSAGSWVSGTTGGKIVEGTAAVKSPRTTKSPTGTGSMRKKFGPNKMGDGAGGSWVSRVMVSGPRHPCYTMWPVLYTTAYRPYAVQRARCKQWEGD